MLSLKHILVASDFCPVSIAALRHALGIARRYHSTVSLLHVIDPVVYGFADPEGITADVASAQHDSERIEADLVRDGSLQGLRFESIVRVGPVWRTIAATIEEKHSALLVLGTHGRTGVGKLVLGSVAENAFREARCPVLTVGPKVLRSKSCGAEAKHFLVPTDLSLQSMSALPYGVSLAEAINGDMTLLHVQDPTREGNEQSAVSIDAAKSRIRELLQTHPDAQAITPFIVEGVHPADAIVAFADQHQMDLIVMGRRAWAADRQPMWKTAYAVVTRASCPVLSMQTQVLAQVEATHSPLLPPAQSNQ